MHTLETGEQKVYTVDEQISEGAYGSVYKVYDKRKELYALKMLKPSVKIEPGRLEREYNTTQKLDHPHIITADTMFKHLGATCLLMEYIQGKTLRKFLNDKKEISTLEETMKFSDNFFDIIDHMHSRQISHRDIKPCNIVMDINEVPNLVDFGLVRCENNEGEGTITFTGVLLGTPGYTAPELIGGKPSAKVDYQVADLYSIGVIFYEMLSGKRLMTNKGLKRMLGRIDPLEKHLKKRNFECSKEISKAIMKGLCTNPKKRYQTAGEFYTALQDAYEKSCKEKKTIVYSLAIGVQKIGLQKLGYELMKNAVEYGDERALNKMGEMYLYGDEIEKNYIKAKEIYEKGAAKGNVVAINNLGNMYYRAYGVNRDYQKAKEWYEKAKEKHYAPSLVNLGIMYYYGHGVEKDYEKVIKLFEEAKIKGFVDPIYELGEMYYYGYGVKKNYTKAKRIYERLKRKGDSNAVCRLGSMYHRGHGIKRNHKKAVEFYEKAKKKSGCACYKLGEMYYYGDGVKQNYEIAKQHFEEAKVQGYTDAWYMLGEIYYYGHGTEQNYHFAQKMYYDIISDMKNTEEEVYKNYKKRIYVDTLSKLTELCCYDYTQDEVYSERELKLSIGIVYELGEMYYYGDVIEQDYMLAQKMYEKAAGQEHISAMYKLGEIYYYGYGVEKDHDKAITFYQKAAGKGYLDATNQLKRILES